MSAYREIVRGILITVVALAAMVLFGSCAMFLTADDATVRSFLVIPILISVLVVGGSSFGIYKLSRAIQFSEAQSEENTQKGFAVDSGGTQQGSGGRGIRIASVLCWVMAIVAGTSVFDPVLNFMMVGFVLLYFLLAVAYCVAGFKLGLARKSGAIIALSTTVVYLVIAGTVSYLLYDHPGTSASIPYFGLVLNLAIVVLLAKNWSQFSPRDAVT